MNSNTRRRIIMAAIMVCLIFWATVAYMVATTTAADAATKVRRSAPTSITSTTSTYTKRTRTAPTAITGTATTPDCGGPGSPTC